MILRELFEARAKSKSVGIIFGRFNPPHMGHIKAWEMASENTAWYVGTNKDTQGPKDPLPFNVKIEIMKTMYPDLEGHLVAETSWLTLASRVYEKHGNIVLNVYTDEEWVTKTIIQYNGKEGAHGYYEFGAIQQQATPRLSSATALRNAVEADDRAAFSKAAGVDADTPIAGHAFFDVVKHYLMPYVAKAAAKPVKKKVKQPEQDVAEGWKGALAGATLGNIVAPGPVGIGAGAGIGHWLGDKITDKKDKRNKSHPAYLKGIAAQKDGYHRSDNTYAQGDDTRWDAEAAWNQGWTDSKKGIVENAWDRLQREKALESAGVGIITKQNSTVDVNKNTPRKNLKAFRLI